MRNTDETRFGGDGEKISLPKIALVVGILLIVLGGWAYIASGPGASPTALIPAVLGVLLAVAGLVGLRGSGARRHAMHTTAAVALLGVLGSAYQLIARPSAGSEHADIAQTAGVLNLALCGLFLVLAIWSFVQARRARLCDGRLG